MQHQSWAPAPQNPQHHTWARDQASLLLSTPFLKRDNLKEFLLFLSLHLILSKQEAAAPLSFCRWVQDLFLSLGTGAEHHLALLHPCHPTGSGCIHLPMAQRGALVRFSSGERLETGLKRNRLFQLFSFTTWVSGRAG